MHIGVKAVMYTGRSQLRSSVNLSAKSPHSPTFLFEPYASSDFSYGLQFQSVGGYLLSSERLLFRTDAASLQSGVPKFILATEAFRTRKMFMEPLTKFLHDAKKLNHR
jgi:hypothetical protein